VFYGWWIVAAGFALQLLNGVLLFNSFGIYFVLLREEFKWSKTVISGAFSMARAESGVLGPLQGWLIDRFGPRLIVTIGLLLFGVGFMLLSQVNSIITFYLVFLLMSIGSSLGGFMAVSTSVANWFARKRATAMGFAMTGMGVGGLLVPVLAWFLDAYGWRAVAFYSGVIIIVIGLPVAQLMRRRPEDHGYLPDGAVPIGRSSGATSADRSTRSVITGYSAREAMRTRAFWLLAIGHASALLVVGAVMVHLVPHIHDEVGLSLRTAGMVVAVMTAMDITGRLVGGILGDRINKRIGVMACMAGHSLGLLALAFATNLPMVLLFSVVHGLAWGARGPMLMSIRADYFGRASYGTIMGFSSLIMMMGMTLGPIFAGVMADQFGDYRIGFIVLAGLAGLGSIAFMFARKPAEPAAVGTLD
jgi:MFS family permease